MFSEKGALRNLTKFTGKHLYQSLFFNNVAGLLWCLKRFYEGLKGLKFLRAPFFKKHLWRLFLKFSEKLFSFQGGHICSYFCLQVAFSKLPEKLLFKDMYCLENRVLLLLLYFCLLKTHYNWSIKEANDQLAVLFPPM